MPWTGPRRSGLGIWTAVVLLVFLPVLGWAAEVAAPNKTAYLKYCSACHGENGKGDGVVSGFMTPKATDLTQIAKQSGGHLSQSKLRQVIDGTTTVRAHGDSNMPVWGEVLRADSSAPLHEQAEVLGKQMLVSEYVESIQVQ